MNERTRYRLLYLAYFAAFSGFGTFRNVYLEEIGLTGFEMGMLGFIITIGGTVSQPFWGFVTDWKGAQRETLILGAVVAGIAVLAYPLGPLLPDTFLVIAVGTVFFAVFIAPITPITDSLVVSSGLNYGRFRVVGSIAFGVGTLAYGALLASLDTSIIFYAFTAGMAALVVTAWGVPESEGAPFQVVGRDALRLVRNPSFVLFFVSAFLVGMTLLPGNDFFSVYMREIGGSDFHTGVAWALATFVEAAAFVYAYRISRRYKSLMILGALVYSAKYLVYVLTGDPLVVIASHFLTGTSFALFYLAGVNLADELAPESLKSSAMAILWTAVFGAGAGAGHLLAGRLVDLVGVQDMYIYLAGIALVAAVVAAFIQEEHRMGKG